MAHYNDYFNTNPPSSDEDFVAKVLAKSQAATITLAPAANTASHAPVRTTLVRTRTMFAGLAAAALLIAVGAGALMHFFAPDESSVTEPPSVSDATPNTGTGEPSTGTGEPSTGSGEPSTGEPTHDTTATSPTSPTVGDSTPPATSHTLSDVILKVEEVVRGDGAIETTTKYADRTVITLKHDETGFSTKTLFYDGYVEVTEGNFSDGTGGYIPGVVVIVCRQFITNERLADLVNKGIIPSTTETFYQCAHLSDCCVKYLGWEREPDNYRNGAEYPTPLLNRLSDITPLAKLTNLHTIDLRDNKISNLRPLRNLTNLRELKLSHNQIVDISPLSRLTNLRSLGLSSNQITDISSLRNLTNLVMLYLANNQITDISSLKNLTYLGSLHLQGNKIVDISALAGATNLSRVNLIDNQIVDFSPLKNLPKLEIAYLERDKIIENCAYFINGVWGQPNCCGSGYWGSMGDDGPLWTIFCNENSYRKFAKENPNALPELVMPRNPLSGFELSYINFIGNQSVFSEWVCPRSSNIIRYNVFFYENATDAQEGVERFLGVNSKPFGVIDKNTVYHYSSRDLDSNRLSEWFTFIANETQVVSVYFDTKIDGVSVSDLGVVAVS